jgi:hypothetical protein
MNSYYVLVEWPDSQDFMDEDWFRDEAIFINDEKVGDSAYFIPLKRHQEFTGKSLMLLKEVFRD